MGCDDLGCCVKDLCLKEFVNCEFVLDGVFGSCLVFIAKKKKKIVIIINEEKKNIT